MKKDLKLSSYHNSIAKTVFDKFISVLSLIILSPVLILISVLIKLSSKGPVLFIQKRVGKNGKVFKMLMFRTMFVGADKRQKYLKHLNEADGPVFKIKNDPRFVGIGKFLSKSGLDEIPQLINVIQGDMSLVGPRPLPPRESEKLTDSQKIRLSVKPGITSEWVIKGSHSLSFKMWMKLDKNYIQNASLMGDFNILYKTIYAILKLPVKNLLSLLHN